MVPPRLLPLLLAFVQAVCAEITYVPGGYIVTIAPSPPPPPLSDVKPNWTALYFFLGVLGMYLLVMGLVLWKGRAKPISAGEGMPLNDKPSDSEAPVTEKGPATRPEGRARSWMELRLAAVGVRAAITRVDRQGDQERLRPRTRRIGHQTPDAPPG